MMRKRLKSMLCRLANGGRRLGARILLWIRVIWQRISRLPNFLRRASRRLLWVGRVLGLALIALATVFGSVVGVSAAVCDKTEERILTLEMLKNAGESYDCVLVLGCRVYSDGTPSPMLADRMETAVEVMGTGVSQRMVVSGDHRDDSYNEVKAMKSYAVERGIVPSAVFQDHDGYSTYESVWRVKEVFGAKRVVIVTQSYHLYRALYLAEKLGLEAVGVAADRQTYAKQPIYDFREIFARCKDVYLGLKQPKGEAPTIEVDLSGDGNTTHQSRPVGG